MKKILLLSILFSIKLITFSQNIINFDKKEYNISNYNPDSIKVFNINIINSSNNEIKIDSIISKDRFTNFISNTINNNIKANDTLKILAYSISGRYNTFNEDYIKIYYINKLDSIKVNYKFYDIIDKNAQQLNNIELIYKEGKPLNFYIYIDHVWTKIYENDIPPRTRLYAYYTVEDFSNKAIGNYKYEFADGRSFARINQDSIFTTNINIKRENPIEKLPTKDSIIIPFYGLDYITFPLKLIEDDSDFRYQYYKNSDFFLSFNKNNLQGYIDLNKIKELGIKDIYYNRNYINYENETISIKKHLYTFDKFGRITQAILEYDDTLKFTYFNDSIIVTKNNNALSKAYFFEKKLVSFILLNECPNYFFVTYNKFNYPDKFIATNSFFSDTINFEYSLTNNFNIIIENKLIYTYNNKNQLINITFFDNSNEISTSSIYEYLNDNIYSIIKHVTYYTYYTDSRIRESKFYKIFYTYNNGEINRQDFIENELFYNSVYTKNNITIFDRDKNGLIYSVKYYEESFANLKETNIYEFKFYKKR